MGCVLESSLKKKKLTIALLLAAASSSFGAASPELEVWLTQATISYQAKDFAETQKTLQQILSLDPKNVSALELLALSQRAAGADDLAAVTYEKLLHSGPKAKASAYGFELGTIRYKQKKLKEARTYFGIAAAANFNPGTSHFFLGVMDFDAKDWKNARHHLTASLTYNDAKGMTPVTRYYLATTYAQLGKSDAAIINYNAAREAVETQKGFNPNDQQSVTSSIRKNALKELKSLDKGAWYASLTYMNQFDSNVQTNPTEVDNPTAQSSQRSGKSIVSLSVGASTSPVRPFQALGSFNFYTNYNYNYLSRDFNFMSYTPTLYFLYKPYKRLSGGLKTSGIFSMKNNLDAEQSRRDLKYRPFSLTADIGPIVRYELTPRITLAAEAYWRPKRYYLDPATGDSRRSGGGVYGKLSAEFVSGFWWWNPGMYLTHEWDHPSGKDFRMRAWGGGISNSSQLTDKLSLSAFFDLVAADYYQTNPKRDDVNIGARVTASHALTDHWALIADIGYTLNESTLTQVFKYNRFVTSAGASYAF